METKKNYNGYDQSDAFLNKSVTHDGSSSSDEEDVKSVERQGWANKWEFLLSVMGCSIGLGNIWRFPYICMKNGGGAFLIPFIIALSLVGVPVFFLELSLGQFMGKGVMHVWSFCPLLKGMGVSMNMLCLICNFYYSMILGWAVIYLVNSFKSPLPWTLCGQAWNTPGCVSPSGTSGISEKLLGNDSSVLGNGTFLNNVTDALVHNAYNISNVTGGLSSDSDLSGSLASAVIVATSQNITNVTTMSSTEEFWLHNVLEISSGLSDIGGLPWHTALALVGANMMVLVGVVKGVRSSGKVVYVTATLPILMLIVFFILGVTLEGADKGAVFYFKPDFGMLLSFGPWMEAFIQVFYSLGFGWGYMITLASYNKFHNNCMRDSLVLSFCAEGYSICGGFVVFMILGHMAFRSGVDISDFARSGPGLAFIVYPEAISYLPLPQLWGFLFFLMLLCLGLDTSFGLVETFLTSLADVWPKFIHKWQVLVSTMTVMSINAVGLLYATRAGMFWFLLTDWYLSAFSIIIQVALECIAVSWLYGIDRFSSDIELMAGRKPYAFFIYAWKYVSPAIVLAIWLVTLVFYKPPSYRGYEYPVAAEIFGWVIANAPFTAVLIYAGLELRKHSGSLVQKFWQSCVPAPEWQPSSLEAREKYHGIPLEAQDPADSRV